MSHKLWIPSTMLVFGVACMIASMFIDQILISACEVVIGSVMVGWALARFLSVWEERPARRQWWQARGILGPTHVIAGSIRTRGVVGSNTFSASVYSAHSSANLKPRPFARTVTGSRDKRKA